MLDESAAALHIQNPVRASGNSYLIQYFVSSLGRDEASCADLLSYLLFTSKYTRDLIEIGYHDAGERIDEIEDFLYASSDGDAEDALVSRVPGR